MKLLSIHLPDSKPTTLALQREIKLDEPTDAVLGARVLLRGPSILILYPEGHRLAGAFEFARASCILRWDSSDVDDYKSMQNWTSEVLVRRPRVDSVTEVLPEPKAVA